MKRELSPETETNLVVEDGEDEVEGDGDDDKIHLCPLLAAQHSFSQVSPAKEGEDLREQMSHWMKHSSKSFDHHHQDLRRESVDAGRGLTT